MLASLFLPLLALTLLAGCSERDGVAEPDAVALAPGAATATPPNPAPSAAPAEAESGEQPTTPDVASVQAMIAELVTTPHRFEVFLTPNEEATFEGDPSRPVISGIFDGDWSSAQTFGPFSPTGDSGEAWGFMVTNGSDGYMYTPGFPSSAVVDEEVLGLALDQWIFIDRVRAEAAGVVLGAGEFSPSSFDTLRGLEELAGLIITIDEGPMSQIRGDQTRSYDFVLEPDENPLFDRDDVTGTLHIDALGNLRSLSTTSGAGVSRVEFFDIGEDISVELPREFIDVSDMQETVSSPPTDGRVADPISSSDLRGLDPTDATAVLEARGFTVRADFDVAEDEEVDRGLVAGTVPHMDDVASLVNEIVIVVSEGPESITMPLLIGLDETAAIEELNSLGLIAEVFTQFTDDPDSAGKVVATVPRLDLIVAPWQNVQIVIGLGLD